MSPDIALALGVFVLALAVTSALAAMAEGRRPVVAGILVLAAAAAVWTAWSQSGGTLTLQDVPMSFVRIIGDLR